MADATNAREILDVLRALQALDNEIREVVVERDEVRSNLERLQVVLSHMDKEVDDKRGKLTEAERWYTAKNKELEDDREKLTRSKSRLGGVTKSKEYMAVQREMDTLRKSIGTREEEVLKLLSAIEEFRSAIQVEEQKIGDLRSEARSEETAKLTRLDEMEKTIAAVKGQRDVLLGRLPPRYAKQYETIYRGRAGVVVVPVSGEACSGCHIHLQPRMISVLIHGETVETCPQCNRFVYVQTSINPPSEGGGVRVD